LFFSNLDSRDYKDQIPYIEVTFVIFSFFLILICVIIMNLMVGLAVDDIKCGMNESALTRRAMQVSEKK
ncbi:hypothetical protein Ciccas_004181, partial [Cichlidogyrus casuarinus]